MWRSDTVVQCDLYIQPATAFETMSQLGERSCVQFIDTHPEGQNHLKKYTMDVKRCEELERKLGYFEYEMLKSHDKVFVATPKTDPKPIHPSEMIMFENMVERWENELVENSETISDLTQDLIEVKEMSLILKEIGPMLDDSKPDMDEIVSKFQEDGGDALYHGKLYIMTGVIERARSLQCQLMLWRISMGNIHYRQTERDLITEDLATGKVVSKVAFMAACQGEELRARMEKVCAAFKANIHPCPRSAEERAELQYKIENRITDLENVLNKSKYYRCMALRSIGKQWRVWLIQVRKTKAIYHNMNLMTLDVPKNLLVGRCWIAERDINKVQKTMDTSTELMGVRAPSVITKVQDSDAQPPTLHYSNRFSRAPQALVNAYGDARYKEINPGLFMLIGLPFLFSVMFSDMGHATILIIIALWMIICEDELKDLRRNEIWDILFGGRYLLLLMGVWSFYAGFCFNQLFTKSLNLSKNNSMYKNSYPEGALNSSSGSLNLGYKSRMNKQYIWGTDPMWQMAKNKVAMKSSQMMKLSIIIGTFHILLGIILSAFNHRYFKNSYAICFQAIPQFLFVTCLFGWFVVLIYYKWWTYYDGNPNIDKSAHCAPPLLPHFLARIFPAEIKMPKECSSVYFFGAQRFIELILNFIIILSILLLLLGTPFYIHLFNQRVKKRLRREMRTYKGRHMKGCKMACKKPCGDSCAEACVKQQNKWQAVMDRHSTPFSSLMTNQLIYTIEFVLGTISHVASYLRLWALAMGHYLISDALWIMVLRTMGLRIFREVGQWTLVLAFAIFAILTFIVLIVVEAVCCFLHALRLHWVEFMSKFYIDEGQPFRPFSFKKISSEMNIKSTDPRYSKTGSRRKKSKSDEKVEI